MSEPKNCHYVSKFLCWYWGTGSGKKHRKVNCLDLATRSIKEDEAENLFSLEQLNSPQVETLLNKLIESPLGRHKKDLIESEQFDYDDPALLVALRLFALIQQLRYFKAKGEPAGAELDSLLKVIASTDEKVVLAWAHAQESKTQIIRFRLRGNDLTFYPERGIFRIPFVPADRQNDMPGWVNAFPIHPRVVIAFVPHHGDLSLMGQLPLSAYSAAGYINCQRFIIPPEILQNHDEKFIIEEFQRLHDVAELQDELLQSIREVQQIAVKVVAGRLSGVEIQRISEEQKRKAEVLDRRMKELVNSKRSINPI